MIRTIVFTQPLGNISKRLRKIKYYKMEKIDYYNSIVDMNLYEPKALIKSMIADSEEILKSSKYDFHGTYDKCSKLIVKYAKDSVKAILIQQELERKLKTISPIKNDIPKDTGELVNELRNEISKEKELTELNRDYDIIVEELARIKNQSDFIQDLAKKLVSFMNLPRKEKKRQRKFKFYTICIWLINISISLLISILVSPFLTKLIELIPSIKSSENKSIISGIIVFLISSFILDRIISRYRKQAYWNIFKKIRTSLNDGLIYLEKTKTELKNVT